jgi:hypothetical protein
MCVHRCVRIKTELLTGPCSLLASSCWNTGLPGKGIKMVLPCLKFLPHSLGCWESTDLASTQHIICCTLNHKMGHSMKDQLIHKSLPSWTSYKNFGDVFNYRVGRKLLWSNGHGLRAMEGSSPVLRTFRLPYHPTFSLFLLWHGQPGKTPFLPADDPVYLPTASRGNWGRGKLSLKGQYQGPDEHRSILL